MPTYILRLNRVMAAGEVHAVYACAGPFASPQVAVVFRQGDEQRSDRVSEGVKEALVKLGVASVAQTFT